jgi:uncharacterized protein (TIGR02145 family)
MKKFSLILMSFLILATSCPKDNEQNEPPSCSIDLPMCYSSFFPDESIEINVSASDVDGVITSVEIFLEGNQLATMNSSPYEFTYEIQNSTPGEYNLKAVSTDDSGDTASSRVNIIILEEPEEFTDPRDGNVYRYADIGNQIWMIDNLSYLPEVHSLHDSSSNDPRYYVYQYNGTDISTAKLSPNYLKSGVLYNFEAAQNVCPSGWHAPDLSEWEELLNHIGSEHQDVSSQSFPRGTIWSKIGKYMRTTQGWLPEESNGLNSYGFSEKPSGAVSFGVDYEYCVPCMGTNQNMAGWWSTTSNEGGLAHAFDTYTGFLDIHESARKKDFPKVFGLSVRCIKDK